MALLRGSLAAVARTEADGVVAMAECRNGVWPDLPATTAIRPGEYALVLGDADRGELPCLVREFVVWIPIGWLR